MIHRPAALSLCAIALRAAALSAFLAAPALASDVEIVAVEAVETGSGWRFSVTLNHADSGWEHYADAWEVRGADGTVYGARILLHPHVNEMPFTRSQSGIVIPGDVSRVYIHARDTPNGWTAKAAPFDLPR